MGPGRDQLAPAIMRQLSHYKPDCFGSQKAMTVTFFHRDVLSLAPRASLSTGVCPWARAWPSHSTASPADSTTVPAESSQAA